MNPVEFKKQHVDIVDILNSNIALGPFRGDEICAELRSLIDTSMDETMMEIDLRRIIWLNTAFCQPAFGLIFENLKARLWSRKYLLFRMNDYHKPGFFQGILKHFDIDVPRKGAESKFISENMYTKIMIGNKNSIEFIGELTEAERNILDVINNLHKADANIIVQKSNLSFEIVAESLLSLEGKYFIVKFEKADQGIQYYSFNNYLRSLERVKNDRI